LGRSGTPGMFTVLSPVVQWPLLTGFRFCAAFAPKAGRAKFSWRAQMLRRDFLKGAVGIAAVPLPSIGGQVSSRNKIRLGLIGCGGRMGLGIQYGILNNLCGPDEEIVCMAEPDPS